MTVAGIQGEPQDLHDKSGLASSKMHPPSTLPGFAAAAESP